MAARRGCCERLCPDTPCKLAASTHQLVTGFHDDLAPMERLPVTTEGAIVTGDNASILREVRLSE
ncbi:MAG: hypothetical protein ACUVSB_00075 [Anaerolineae bacterium]